MQLDYTKVSNEMLKKKYISITSAVIYGKLAFRMNLSLKQGDKFNDDNYYIIYRINDLANELGISRGTVIRSIKQLAKYGYVSKKHTIFCTKLYLPKFNIETTMSKSETHESSKSKLSYNNKYLRKNNNKYSKSVGVKKNARRSQPTINGLRKRFGNSLVELAQCVANRSEKPIYNLVRFLGGVLNNWKLNGVQSVHDAIKIEEKFDPSFYELGQGIPDVPIFKL